MMMLLTWFYLTAFAVLLGAEVNAELERQTKRDTTTGPARRPGQRGATVADTTAHSRPGERFRIAVAPARAILGKSTFTGRMTRNAVGEPLQGTPARERRHGRKPYRTLTPFSLPGKVPRSAIQGWAERHQICRRGTSSYR